MEAGMALQLQQSCFLGIPALVAVDFVLWKPVETLHHLTQWNQKTLLRPLQVGGRSYTKSIFYCWSIALNNVNNYTLLKFNASMYVVYLMSCRCFLLTWWHWLHLTMSLFRYSFVFWHESFKERCSIKSPSLWYRKYDWPVFSFIRRRCDNISDILWRLKLFVSLTFMHKELLCVF